MSVKLFIPTTRKDVPNKMAVSFLNIAKIFIPLCHIANKLKFIYLEFGGEEPTNKGRRKMMHSSLLLILLLISVQL